MNSLNLKKTITKAAIMGLITGIVVGIVALLN